MQDNREFARGYSAKSEIIEWTDYKSTKEEIDGVIAPFITVKVKVQNQEIYLTNKEN